jgi:hypothetical protein
MVKHIWIGCYIVPGMLSIYLCVCAIAVLIGLWRLYIAAQIVNSDTLYMYVHK